MFQVLAPHDGKWSGVMVQSLAQKLFLVANLNYQLSW